MVRSTSCTGTFGSNKGPCEPCSLLLKNTVIEGIQHRNKYGAPKHIPWMWLTMADITTILHLKNEQLNQLRLAGLNMAQSLLTRARQITALNHFVVAVGEGKVPRMHSLVSISRKAGDSIYAILEKYDQAVHQVYRPMSYEEQDFQRVFLFHKLGGVAVAELAHRTFGLPSIGTTRRHIVTQPLVASPKMPTIAEMTQNLEHAFPKPEVSAILSTGRCRGGFQMMADEIKTETRMRWDARTNMILGICREHGKTYGLEFKSMAQAFALRDGIANNKVHLATEVSCLHFSHQQSELVLYKATVLAVSVFSDDPRLYGARPFVISGTCKREEVPSQTLLKNACEALSAKSPDICRRLYSLASDGDTKRRRATALLTLISKVMSDSPLHEKLGIMSLFNYLCGKNDLTGDIDYKHILKRLRNTLLRLKCMTLDGVVLTPQLIKAHLLNASMLDERGINALLSPKDKQDVKLMYDLLTSIACLPDADATNSPAEQQTRGLLVLLGKLYAHLLEAYTNIDLTLHQQLTHLSAAAHLIIAFYAKEKGGSMPSQLYFDLMTMIKNAYFCVAKTQVDDPEGSFWIILLGSDPLEALVLPRLQPTFFN